MASDLTVLGNNKVMAQSSSGEFYLVDASNTITKSSQTTASARRKASIEETTTADEEQYQTRIAVCCPLSISFLDAPPTAGTCQLDSSGQGVVGGAEVITRRKG